MTEPIPEHHIDLVKIEGLARLGIQRAAVFMGLGLHAAYRDDFKDYEVTKLPRSIAIDSMPITIVSDGANDAVIKKYKGEFAEWIVPTVLGEVLEHFALYLNHIHFHALVVCHVRGLNKHLGDFEKVRRNFEEAPGLRDKLERLARKEFGITTPHAEEIAQLYALRNACTHNFRYVGPKQARKAGELVVRWMTFEMHGVQGAAMVSMRELFARPFESETKVRMQAIRREHRFKLGERVNLTHEQVAEICLFFNTWCIPTMSASFMDFLKRHDVPVSPPPSQGKVPDA